MAIPFIRTTNLAIQFNAAVDSAAVILRVHLETGKTLSVSFGGLVETRKSIEIRSTRPA